MKQRKHLFITAMMLLCGLTASAEDFAVNNIYYNITSSTDLTVEVTCRGSNYTSYPNEYSGDITIPETVTYNSKAYRVTSIAGYAFYDCSSLTSITIPESVTSIASYAFYGCSSLTSIIIPKSVVSIGNEAFSDCSNITSIELPQEIVSVGYQAFYGTAWWNNQNDGVVYLSNWLLGYKGTMPASTSIDIAVGTIGIAVSAFVNNANLVAVSIPNSIKCLSKNSFYGTGLTTVEIPSSVISIDENAFGQCTRLKSIHIPASVESIGTKAFYKCSSLESLTIADNTKATIGNNAFESCTKLASISFGDSELTIGEKSFYSCSGLTELTLKNVKSVGIQAFSGASGLITLSIEDVETIGVSAFNGCKKLQTVRIGCGVKSIEGMAFYGCSSVINFYIDDLESWCNVELEENSSVPLFYDAGSMYVNGIKISSLDIPSSLTVIKPYTFWHAWNITSVTIPASITSIGSGAFSGCSNLQEVTCKALNPPSMERNEFVNAAKATLYVPGKSMDSYRNASYWSNFSSIEAYDVLTLEDYQENFIQKESEEYSSINYKRTFNNTNWQALYVPFEIPVDADFASRFDVAYFNDVRSYDDDKDGAVDRMVMELFEIEEGNTLKANYPYLIRAKKTGEATITVTDAVLYATEENSISCSSVFMNYEVFGTYTQKTAAELQGCYAVSNGGWKQAASENVVLNPFRLWLKLTPIDGSPVKVSEKAMRSISIRLAGEEDTTEIEGVELVPQGSDIIYDLQGRRVENPTRGIYIVNGKKVYIENR